MKLISLDEAKERNKVRKDHIHFPSTLNHLRDHNGFRPGELGLLIGEKGGGKSSLFRSWICECLANEKKVYIRLSEEKSLDYQDEIVESLGRVIDVDGMENLKVDSELEMSYDQHGAQYFDDLTINLRNFQADILFFDNFSTSELSDGHIQLQGQNAKKLRSMAMKLNIPIIIANHTVKGFKGGIATGDSARGNMTLSNTAAYIYTINVFFGLPGKPSILFVDKARHHTNSNKSLYELKFEPKVGLYVSDSKTSRAAVADMIRSSK